MSEWQHASWVSQLGKWAWIIILVNGILGIIFGIAGIAIWFYFPWAVASYVWNVIGGIIIILLDFIIIWGVIFEIIGWYGWGGVFILIPAIMLLFLGPKQYNWTKEGSKPKPKPEPESEA